MSTEAEWRERCEALGINDVQLSLLLDTSVCNCRRWKKGGSIRGEYHWRLANCFLSGEMDCLARCIQKMSQQMSDWQEKGRRLSRVWHRFYFAQPDMDCSEKVSRLYQVMLGVYAENLCQK